MVYTYLIEIAANISVESANKYAFSFTGGDVYWTITGDFAMDSMCLRVLPFRKL